MKTAIIIPAYNEEERIGATLEAVGKIPGVDRILVVDDGSTDETVAIAREAGAEVMALEENQGKGEALRRGLVRARDAEIVVFLDADLGASAQEAGKLLHPVLEGWADMTIARFPPAKKKGGFGFVKSLARWGIQKTTGLRMESPLSGQRAMRREIIEQLEVAAGFGVEVALTIDAFKAGFRLKEVPVNMTHAETARSWAGFCHRGKQFFAVLGVLVPRLFLGQKG